ncbi:MAG: DUF3341 domain-containing protein [Bacteroidales bacterium]|nr:DUF3341 domain-containing protein [Bacteroidales bacterium]
MSSKTIIGVFDDENLVVNTIRKLNEKKVRIRDVYGPFASHDIISAIAKPSRLPHLSFLFGAGTVFGTFAFLYYTSVVDYPHIYGGKPVFSFPPMVVIMYLATILVTGTLSVFTFLGISGMYPGKKAQMPGIGTMDDKFFLVIDENDANATSAEALLMQHGALEIKYE